MKNIGMKRKKKQPSIVKVKSGNRLLCIRLLIRFECHFETLEVRSISKRITEREDKEGKRGGN